MGRVVTFEQLSATSLGEGVSEAAITEGDTKEMAAALIRIAPGKRWTASVPHGSDCYLFLLGGAAILSAAGSSHRLSAQSFATIEEGVELSIENDSGATAEIVKVLAPPRPSDRQLAGFKDKISVAERAKVPVVAVPEQKKRRLYFVGDHAARSERGHAMIVLYEKDTVTALHHHPNAESMFVPLDGALEFTANGKQVLVGPGQAAYFGMHDTHGLHVADGHSGASFLEFHIPGAFTTVKE